MAGMDSLQVIRFELIVPKKSHKFFNYFHDASMDILSHQKTKYLLFYRLVLYVAYLNIYFKGYANKENYVMLLDCIDS